MSKLKEFNKPALNKLRSEMQSQFAELEKKFGIKLQVGSMSYSSNEVSVKVKANIISDDGTVVSKEAKAWDLYAQMGGFDYLKVGDKIVIQGQTFTIKGYNTRAPKSPIQIEDAQGKSYKCSEIAIKQAKKAI